MAEVEDGIT